MLSLSEALFTEVFAMASPGHVPHQPLPATSAQHMSPLSMLLKMGFSKHRAWDQPFLKK